MLTDEVEALPIAAILSAAQLTANTTAARSGQTPAFRDTAVDVQINVLREMEKKG
jgi:hypothetical protein